MTAFACLFVTAENLIPQLFIDVMGIFDPLIKQLKDAK
jgi:hypothetical protein